MVERKVLIIGIDGGTWTILKSAMDEGYIPYVNRLVEAGASGVLESTKPAITPAAWATFQTGVNPGKNGVFDFAVWDKRQRKRMLVNSQSLQRTIWEAASEAGKRVGVVNVPMTYPPKAVNGYLITGILTPSVEADFTYPPALKEELLAAVPDYHIFNLKNVKNGAPHEQFEAFVQRMVDIIDNRAKAARYLLGKDSFDLFMVHFQATDVIQHRMWGYLEESHPLYDPGKRQYILEHFYGQLDKQIHEVRRSFEQTTQGDYLTFIISDHGCQVHKKRFNLGNWLYQEGFLDLDPKSFRESVLVRWIRKADVCNLRMRFLSREQRSQATKALNRLEGRDHRFHWDRTRVFSVGRSNEGFIYLLEDTESKREATAAELVEKLSAVRDPELGTPIISRIWRKEEIYSGEYLNLMPDLLIEPRDGYSFTGYYQPNADLFHTVNPQDDFHVGKHHKDGLLVAVGGATRQQECLQAHLIDIAPTILYYLGLPISDSIDGRVLEELFTETFLEKRPVKKAVSREPISQQEKGTIYSSEDEESIRERLEGLGYLS